MDFDLGTAIAKFGFIAGGGAWLLSIAIKKWFDTRTDIAASGAKVDIIDMLANRVTGLEEAVSRARTEFDAERALRFAAEERVAKLLQRITVLEHKLRTLGESPENIL